MAKRRARAATVFSPPERLSMGRNLATRRDNKHINKYILILESALACIELFRVAFQHSSRAHFSEKGRPRSYARWHNNYAYLSQEDVVY